MNVVALVFLYHHQRRRLRRRRLRMSTASRDAPTKRTTRRCKRSRPVALNRGLSNVAHFHRIVYFRHHRRRRRYGPRC